MTLTRPISTTESTTAVSAPPAQPAAATTGSAAVLPIPSEREGHAYQTGTISSLVREYGLLRDETTVLDERVGDGHRAAQVRALDQRARARAQQDVRSLLEELSRDRGLGWSVIARLVGVSVQAIRKWRRGESATGENRLAVARLAAVLDLLEQVPIQDPASWLEMPVVDGFKPRILDLYRAGHADVLLDLAGLRITPEAVLDETEPAWRTTLQLEHEVFAAEDGQLSIRRRR